MSLKITLFPIYALAGLTDREVFDQGVLPFEIVPDVAVENVTSLFDTNTFAWVRNELGRRDLQTLQNVQHAIVHRYEVGEAADGGTLDLKSEDLVRNLVACLRLIRPMRQRTSFMRGELTVGGKFDVKHFEHPRELMDVPEVQKLFHLRNGDLVLLRAIASEFLRAMAGEFWKFRMAVDFHEAGHFQDWYWKARYSLWCSALESLFTSNAPEHRYSLVATERIKWFLGANTSIYDPGDIPDFVRPRPNISLGDVVSKIYAVRNFIAHGDRIPDEYFERKMRQGLNGELSLLQVLIEAVSFVVRKSLLRILQNNLLDNFANAAASEAFFGAEGLTNTAIRQRQQLAR